MKPTRHDPMAGRLQAAHAAGNWPLLIRLCRQTLRTHPRHLKALRFLGFALHENGDNNAALEAFQKAASLLPNDAELLVNYGNLLLTLGRNGEALPILEKVVQLRPDHSTCWSRLAQCCYLLTLHQQGFDASQRALETAQNKYQRADALMQSATHRRELGQIRESIADCKEGIALFPDVPHNYTNCLLFMLADPDCTMHDVLQLAKAYEAHFGAPLRPQWPDFADIDRSPWRRLRIGFVSADLRNHSVMYFVEGLLAQLDRRMFEVVAFYNFPTEDIITERVRHHVDQFVSIHGLTPAAQAQTIKSTGIDIVVDLAGHTGNNCLQALAHKPAPIQVSWLGYPATTGLQSMDYKFTDEITDPADADQEYSERLYRLPTLFCCYRPMIRGPLLRYQPKYLVRPTPALANGYVTFGSCNNLGKLTDEVLSLWGRLMDAVPNARLLIEGKNLDIPETAMAFGARCARMGIPQERLELVGLDLHNQYLTYHRIDIALDPFPLTGGTTTFDLLWMGVPLVSMEGQHFRSRLSTGILSYLGRTEWLAHDETAYLQIAQTLASDIAELNHLRLSLRQQVEQSPLMREDLHTHYFGEGLRVMWLQWLAQQQHPNDESGQQQALTQWVQEYPPEWNEPPTPGVGLEPGKRVPLPEAHALLQDLVEQAKTQAAPSGNTIEDRRWINVTELAEKVLCAIPHDPVALACLAEVEHAHGHTDFAVTYLRYATEAMAIQAPVLQ